MIIADHRITKSLRKSRDIEGANDCKTFGPLEKFETNVGLDRIGGIGASRISVEDGANVPVRLLISQLSGAANRSLHVY
jgi:hypothetical protein